MSEILSAILASELWEFVFPAALAIFAFSQVLKIIFRINTALPGLGPLTMRLVAALSSYPLTWAIMAANNDAISHWAIPVPHALIAWLFAHGISEYGMAGLREMFPKVYRIFNADRRVASTELPPHEERRKPR